MIDSYLRNIQVALAAYSWVKSVEIIRCDIEETDIEEILLYRFRISLQGGGLLEIMERVVLTKHTGDLQVTTYKYHWQDKNKRLIKRWDNAPHFLHLTGFPHHVHLADGNTTIPNKPMTALELFTSIEREMS